MAKKEKKKKEKRSGGFFSKVLDFFIVNILWVLLIMAFVQVVNLL